MSMARNVIESNVIEYSGIKSISGFTCIVPGEDENNFYDKKFRYSGDKILWSDYRPLTNKNLSDISINDDIVYIQYKFNLVGSRPLTVESISLDVDYIKDDNVIPECFWTSGNKKTPQIVYSQNGNNLFNPYDISASLGMYSQLSTLVSNMFGICVQYFKTAANSRSRDVVLKEYSLENVIDNQNIKILVPDNALPSRELQFNQMMIDYANQFEIQIVKSEFQKVFGVNSHPDPHDYLYFQNYLNKMYMVDSVSDPDDFGYMSTYWRVSLVPYQNMKSVGFADDNLMKNTDQITFSVEGKFKDEINDEIADARKDNQLNDIGDLSEGQDDVRRILHENVRIVEENIYNDWTAVAKQYYNLSTIEKGEKAVEYKYSGLSSNDERMITFAFRPSNLKNVTENIMIDSIMNNNGKIRFKLKSWNNLLVNGNMVKLSRVSGMKGWYRISNIEKNRLIVDIDYGYDESVRLMSCGKMICYEANSCVYVEPGFEVIQMPDRMMVVINGKNYEYLFDEFSSFERKWYFCVFGLKNGLSNMWLYEVSGSETLNNTHSEIKYVGVSSNDIDSFNMTGYFGLKGGNLHLTNFRLWNKLCEQDLHKLILSQYIVDDTHNTLIVDNAQNELLVNYKWS